MRAGHYSRINKIPFEKLKRILDTLNIGIELKYTSNLSKKIIEYVELFLEIENNKDKYRNPNEIFDYSISNEGTLRRLLKNNLKHFLNIILMTMLV